MALSRFCKPKNEVNRSLQHRGEQHMTTMDRFLVVVIATFAGSAIPACAATPVTSCTNITASGNYELTTDLNCGSGGGIFISASNVTLKLNGHIITGSGADVNAGIGIGIGPFSGRLNHVTISGPGLIQKFTNGIQLTSTDYAQVALVTVAHNLQGLIADDVTFMTVGSNGFLANKTYGVVLTLATNCTLTQNKVSGNGTLGLNIGGLVINTGSHGATLNANTSDGNGGDGIAIFANNSRTYGNSTSGNSGAGIRVGTSFTGNEIFTNTSSVGNGTYDLQDENSACGGNTWADNVFFVPNQSCIR
jgi:hypothetical protein